MTNLEDRLKSVEESDCYETPWTVSSQCWEAAAEIARMKGTLAEASKWIRAAAMIIRKGEAMPREARTEMADEMLSVAEQCEGK
jgi:hypothetical protein